uniref:Uncharacterized protein n=1 Tax=Micrurus spixii TaxID=129469 RepID=A0A2D4NJI5_9SAUR
MAHGLDTFEITVLKRCKMNFKEPFPAICRALKLDPFSNCIQQSEEELACKFTATIIQEILFLPQYVGLHKVSREKWTRSVVLSALNCSNVCPSLPPCIILKVYSSKMFHFSTK